MNIKNDEAPFPPDVSFDTEEEIARFIAELILSNPDVRTGGTFYRDENGEKIGLDATGIYGFSSCCAVGMLACVVDKRPGRLGVGSSFLSSVYVINDSKPNTEMAADGIALLGKVNE